VTIWLVARRRFFGGKDGVLIDGRNRWAACQMAGVDPRFDVLNGQDPVAYILSSNIKRRHMNAGQRAMAIAASVSVSDTKISRERRDELAKLADAGSGKVGQAFMILRWREDLVSDVIAGVETLDAAYTKAKARKEGKDTDEARMAKLQASRFILMVAIAL
jgi:hypothetical protein